MHHILVTSDIKVKHSLTHFDTWTLNVTFTLECDLCNCMTVTSLVGFCKVVKFDKIWNLTKQVLLHPAFKLSHLLISQLHINNWIENEGIGSIFKMVANFKLWVCRLHVSETITLNLFNQITEGCRQLASIHSKTLTFVSHLDTYGSPLVPRTRMEWEYFMWRPPDNLCGGRHLIIWRPPHNLCGGRHLNYLVVMWRTPDN